MNQKGSSMQDNVDVVLSGGTVVDPASGLRTEADVAVVDGKIAGIGQGLAAGAGTETVDCRGALVVPGLIDAHTHIFYEVSKVGAPVDEAHLRRGVVAAVDAGTAGASTFAAFKRLVVQPSQTRVLSFLNVSVLGLIDFRFGELLNPLTLVPEDAIETAKANPDIVRGLKIRMSTDVVGEGRSPGMELLDAAIATGQEAGLPLMVHIGETPVALDEILERLRPGDVVAHCYTGKEEGILADDGQVREAVHAARQRGVLFESAHGKSNFSYAVARPAIEQGFFPDVVCSDTSYRNWNGPVYDLLTTISKLVALGMTFDDVLHRTTVAPAQRLGLWDEGFGRLEVGGPAYVTVLSQRDEVEEVPDAAGNTMTLRRFEPKVTVAAGAVVSPLPWRGAVASTT
ncbi:MAG TPA: amidohydrolase/deacetylase family metallohydrolase [Acidimicrobiales bacterium]|nr:amidohydrolase/deacetylase family metallohydrolase [Acidimicrobiales bacterium]